MVRRDLKPHGDSEKVALPTTTRDENITARLSELFKLNSLMFYKNQPLLGLQMLKKKSQPNSHNQHDSYTHLRGAIP